MPASRVVARKRNVQVQSRIATPDARQRGIVVVNASIEANVARVNDRAFRQSLQDSHDAPRAMVGVDEHAGEWSARVQRVFNIE